MYSEHKKKTTKDGEPPVELDLTWRREFDKAHAFDVGKKKPDGREEWLFLPKSLIEKTDDGNLWIVPHWLAKEKGLI